MKSPTRTKLNPQLRKKPADLYHFRIIHLQPYDSCSTERCRALDLKLIDLRPPKVFRPMLCPRTEQGSFFTSCRVGRKLVRPFVAVAAWARETKVFKLSSPTMAAWHNVINRKPSNLTFNRHQAIFATTARTFDHLATKTLGDIAQGYSTNSGASSLSRLRASCASSFSLVRRSEKPTSDMSSSCSRWSKNSLRSPRNCIRSLMAVSISYWASRRSEATHKLNAPSN